MAFSCDVVMYFVGQPKFQAYIGPDRKAKTPEHAVALAKLDAQAKGWDLKRLDEVQVVGGVYE